MGVALGTVTYELRSTFLASYKDMDSMRVVMAAMVQPHTECYVLNTAIPSSILSIAHLPGHV